MTKANLLQKEDRQEQIKQAREGILEKARSEKARLKKLAIRGTDTVKMPDGKVIDAIKKERRSSYERQGYVRVYKNMTPVNIQDALDKGFRAVIDEDAKQQVERSGGQTLSDGGLLRQLWMEIPKEKWDALKKAESTLRLNKNKEHIKKHIYNRNESNYEDRDKSVKTEFSSPNLGSGIDLSELKEEHLQQ